jgi:hypothetical protein
LSDASKTPEVLRVHAYRIRLWTVCLLPLLLFGGFAVRNAEPVSDELKSSSPFPIPERLVYSVEWDPPWFLFFLPRMDAGEAELHLTGETEYNGKKALKISFKARSSGTLVRLSGVKVDDEFTFLTDPDSFCTLAATKRIREGKRKKQINVEYLRDTRQLHYKEIDETATSPKLTKDEVKSEIPECVQDPFSALYTFRESPLKLDFSQSFTIGDNDKVKEVQAQVEEQEIIQCAAGTFPAWKVNTASLMGGLFKEGGQLRLWISVDERKLPVQFEVKMHLGRAFGKLKSIQ